MTDRDARTQKIRDAAAGHAVVRFTASSLLPEDEHFRPRPGFAEALEERLRSLGPSDELVSAVLGLTELAYLLGRDGSAEAGDMVHTALRAIQPLVSEALSALPELDPSLAALRGAQFAAFAGDAAGARLEPRQPPAKNQVASGPLARAAMLGITKKNKNS